MTDTMKQNIVKGESFTGDLHSSLELYPLVVPDHMEVDWDFITPDSHTQPWNLCFDVSTAHAVRRAFNIKRPAALSPSNPPTLPYYHLLQHLAHLTLNIVLLGLKMAS